MKFPGFAPMLRVLLLLALCGSARAAVNEDVYYPSSKVSDYHHYGKLDDAYPFCCGRLQDQKKKDLLLLALICADFDTSVSYATKVAVRPGVVIGVGLVVFILLVFWSLCRCCKCCGCQRPSSSEVFLTPTPIHTHVCDHNAHLIRAEQVQDAVHADGDRSHGRLCGHDYLWLRVSARRWVLLVYF